MLKSKWQIQSILAYRVRSRGAFFSWYFPGQRLTVSGNELRIWSVWFRKKYLVQLTSEIEVTAWPARSEVHLKSPYVNLRINFFELQDFKSAVAEISGAIDKSRNTRRCADVPLWWR
jgi:hypothetical protein